MPLCARKCRCRGLVDASLVLTATQLVPGRGDRVAGTLGLSLRGGPMVEVDTEAALSIEHTDSVTVILIPLADAPPESWRRIFRQVGDSDQVRVVDVDGRAWIRVLIHQGELGGSDATVERLEKAVQLVALTNHREAEQRDQWAALDERLRSWWSTQSQQ